MSWLVMQVSGHFGTVRPVGDGVLLRCSQKVRGLERLERPIVSTNCGVEVDLAPAQCRVSSSPWISIMFQPSSYAAVLERTPLEPVHLSYNWVGAYPSAISQERQGLDTRHVDNLVGNSNIRPTHDFLCSSEGSSQGDMYSIGLANA